MVVFREDSPLYSTEVESTQGENVMYVNYLKAPFVPAIADDSSVMSRTVDSLIENTNVSRLVFVQQRNYNYPANQVLMLAEMGRVHNFLSKQEAILSPEKLSLFGNVPEVHSELQFLLTLLKQDPIACYLEI